MQDETDMQRVLSLGEEGLSSHTQGASSGWKSADHSPLMLQEPPNIGQKWLPEWLKVGEVLSNRLGTTVFKSWFLDIVLVDLTLELAVLQVNSAFWKNYVENHYQYDIEWAFATCYPTLKTIKIQVQENNHA